MRGAAKPQQAVGADPALRIDSPLTADIIM